MKAYILMVVGAAMLSAFADMFAPESWRKYVKIATGLMILAVLLTPVLKLKDVDLFSGFSPDISAAEQTSVSLTDGVAKQLKENVEQDAEERIETEFATDARVSAEIDTTDDGKIRGVRKLYVHTDRNEMRIQKRLAEVYGVAESEVVVGR